MRSLTVEHLTALRSDVIQGTTLRSLGDCQGKQLFYVAQSPETLKDLRQAVGIEPPESSKWLESVIAPSRLRSLAIRNAMPKSHSGQKIADYRDALTLIRESARHIHTVSSAGPRRVGRK